MIYSHLFVYHQGIQYCTDVTSIYLYIEYTKINLQDGIHFLRSFFISIYSTNNYLSPQPQYTVTEILLKLALIALCSTIYNNYYMI